jgi:hypothetical protein
MQLGGFSSSIFASQSVVHVSLQLLSQLTLALAVQSVSQSV